MASESLQCKALVLKVSIHCEGCKKKVKKVLQSVEGVYKCDVDARSNKVTVAITGRVSADALIKKLRRSGKHAEEWPEEQQQQQQRQPTDTLIPGETKNQTTEPDKPVAPTEKPASGNSDANAAEAELSSANASVEPKKITSGTAKPIQECAQSNTANADVNHGGAKERSNEPKRKRKLQPEEGQPADAMATAVQGHAGYLSLAPLPLQQPAHVVNYSVARPSTSASYYSAAAVPGAMLPAMPLPSQEYSAYYYLQPSPYRFSCGYGTPARDSYCDLFSDDNANSCTVM